MRILEHRLRDEENKTDAKEKQMTIKVRGLQEKMSDLVSKVRGLEEKTSDLVSKGSRLEEALKNFLSCISHMQKGLTAQEVKCSQMQQNMVEFSTQVVTNIEVLKLRSKTLEDKMRVWRDVMRQYDMDAVMPEPDAASASCDDASAPSHDAHDSEDEARQLAWAMKMSMQKMRADDDAHAPSAEDDESLPSHESIAICLPSDRTNANDDSENANDGEPHGESGHRRRL